MEKNGEATLEIRKMLKADPQPAPAPEPIVMARVVHAQPVGPPRHTWFVDDANQCFKDCCRCCCCSLEFEKPETLTIIHWSPENMRYIRAYMAQTERPMLVISDMPMVLCMSMEEYIEMSGQFQERYYKYC